MSLHFYNTFLGPYADPPTSPLLVQFLYREYIRETELALAQISILPKTLHNVAITDAHSGVTVALTNRSTMTSDEVIALDVYKRIWHEQQIRARTFQTSLIRLGTINSAANPFVV